MLNVVQFFLLDRTVVASLPSATFTPSYLSSLVAWGGSRREIKAKGIKEQAEWNQKAEGDDDDDKKVTKPEQEEEEEPEDENESKPQPMDVSSTNNDPVSWHNDSPATGGESTTAVVDPLDGNPLVKHPSTMTTIAMFDTMCPDHENELKP